MEKLNFKKESTIEILRLIEKKINEENVAYLLGSPADTIIINFSVYFYLWEGGVKGDVYFEKIGHLK